MFDNRPTRLFNLVATDLWTSVNMESFIAVTGHFIDKDFQLVSILLECSLMRGQHTSENLAENLNRIVTDWGLQDKVLLIVSDNASNIKKAISVCLKWKHFGCFAHTLNLIVRDALSIPSVEELINKVRTIVGHFRRSYVSSQKLADYQRQINPDVEPLKVIQDVSTRWNSTYFMLERFTHLENAIKSTIAILDNVNIPVLTPTEWQMCKELATVLRPFEKTTKTISGENYITGSYVIPLVNGLYAVCSNLLKRKFEDITICVIQKLNQGIQTRLGQVECSNTLAFAAFLDPRFKHMAFENNSIAESTKKQIISMVAAKIEAQQKQTISEPMYVDDSQEEDESDDLSIWGTLQNNIKATSQPINNATSRAIIEVQRYMETDFLPRNENPLRFWKEQSFNFPNLGAVAQERLCVLATSVPCERQFSKAGLIITDRRNKLSANKAEKLMFLNANHKILKK